MSNCFGLEGVEISNRIPTVLDARIVDDSTSKSVDLTNRILTFVVREGAIASQPPVVELSSAGASPAIVVIAPAAGGQAAITVQPLGRQVPSVGEWLLWELRVADASAPAMYAIVDAGVLHVTP
jgi:hypothetical protein